VLNAADIGTIKEILNITTGSDSIFVLHPKLGLFYKKEQMGGKKRVLLF
jgi:hypothetical protein